MTHQSTIKLVKYIYSLLISTIIVITLVPGSSLTGKSNGAQASSSILGMKETLQTFRASGCLTSPLEVKCPEATFIDIISARYGALSPNSTEEKNCLHPPDPSSVTVTSVTSTTRAQRAPPYYTSFNDYLDDSESTVSLPGRRRVRHSRRHRSRPRRRRDDDYDDDNCQGHLDIKDLLESICRTRQKCVFSLESDELSAINICNSTNGDIYSDLRFLEVEYRCGPSTRSQYLLCEGDTFSAECGEGQRMVIFDGYFGMLEKERPPLISLGSLAPSTSCERFAKRLHEKRREMMVMRRYSLDNDTGSLVDPVGRAVDPWFQLSTCRTTAMKRFLMHHCHGRRSCTFDVTKQTLWHPELLANCKKDTSLSHSHNSLKVEYACEGESKVSEAKPKEKKLRTVRKSSTTVRAVTPMQTVNCSASGPLDGKHREREKTILPMNSFISAYSFILRNREKLILYALVSTLSSLVCILIFVSCYLYCTRRRIARRYRKLGRKLCAPQSGKASGSPVCRPKQCVDEEKPLTSGDSLDARGALLGGSSDDHQSPSACSSSSSMSKKCDRTGTSETRKSDEKLKDVNWRSPDSSSVVVNRGDDESGTSCSGSEENDRDDASYLLDPSNYQTSNPLIGCYRSSFTQQQAASSSHANYDGDCYTIVPDEILIHSSGHVMQAAPLQQCTLSTFKHPFAPAGGNQLRASPTPAVVEVSSVTRSPVERSPSPQLNDLLIPLPPSNTFQR